MGFLKKLPALPMVDGAGNLDTRICETTCDTSFNVGDVMPRLTSSCSMAPYFKLKFGTSDKWNFTDTIIYRPFNSFLKILSRYSNLQSSLLKILKVPVAISNAQQL